MQRKKTEKMTPKKVFYIFLTMVLGGFLGCLAYGLTAIAYAKRGPIFPALFWLLVVAGIISGFFLGFRWWRIVYIEHRHWKWRKNHYR